MFPLKVYRSLGRVLEPYLARRLPPPRRGFLKRADVWLHAASVGEAGVAAAIIKAFRQRRKDLSFLLTLQTETGLKRATALLEGEALVSLAPLDLPGFVERAFSLVRPKVFALIETELWPNLIVTARRRGTKLLLLNGRLSARALKRYRWLKDFWGNLLKNFEALGVIGEEEAKRFLLLGAPEERISILGNAKYDLLWARAQTTDPKEIKGLIGGARLVTFGSLRGGEEKAAAKAASLLLKRHPGLKVALVPRHLSLVEPLKRESRRLGLAATLLSRLEPTKDVIIVDEIGPLLKFYAASEAAFVGGSLVPKGGQNPLEPALFKKPVFFGPHMGNFPYEARALRAALGEETVVRDGEELAARISFLLANPHEARRRGDLAHQVVKKFLGASARYAALLGQALSPAPP